MIMVTIIVAALDAYSANFDPKLLYLGTFIIDCTIFECWRDKGKGEEG